MYNALGGECNIRSAFIILTECIMHCPLMYIGANVHRDVIIYRRMYKRVITMALHYTLVNVQKAMYYRSRIFPKR